MNERTIKQNCIAYNAKKKLKKQWEQNKYEFKILGRTIAVKRAEESVTHRAPLALQSINNW